MLANEPPQLNMGLPERTRSYLQSHFGFVLEDIVTDKDGKENIGVLLPSREGLTRLDSEELERYMSFMTGEKG
tara:strand:- start:930 stop:1148 length:219 start_codon:yes stop_codon:yes gene_type:complete